jgi:RNA polymerase sigma-70 factor (ECF subfamily)
MQKSDSDITLLIGRARQETASKLGDLLEQFRPRLLKVAEKLVSSQMQRRMSTSDLVQETMMSASNQFSSFRGNSKDELHGWLLGILRSRLVDGLRRHRIAERRRQAQEISHDQANLIDVGLSPCEQAAVSEQALQLALALQELPEEQQQIVRMRYLEDRTFEEIAEMLGISISAVWRRWTDALETLKFRLQ